MNKGYLAAIILVSIGFPSLVASFFLLTIPLLPIGIALTGVGLGCFLGESLIQLSRR